MKTKRFEFLMKESMKEDVKREAKKNGVSAASWITEAIKEKLLREAK